MDKKEKLEVNKMSALFQLFVNVEEYHNRHYDARIVKAIFEKKSRLIKEAETIEELKNIMNGPKPFDDSGATVPEEEMIMWSEASLKAPLNSQATERYLTLVQNCFGKEIFA